MFFRQCYSNILNWINEGSKYLQVMGPKGVGKTYLVREALKETRKDYIEISDKNVNDFLELIKLVKKNGYDSVRENISFTFSHQLRMDTIIYIDVDTDTIPLDTILSFVSGLFNRCIIVSMPSNTDALLDTEIIYIDPMNFYEFLLAFSVSEYQINELKEAFLSKTEVEKKVHRRMLNLFYSYTILGGLPKVVDNYLKTKDYFSSSLIQNEIIDYYKDRLEKAQGAKKQYLDVFNQIPVELDDLNKRFFVAHLVKKMHFDRFVNNFNYLSNLGVAYESHALDKLNIPLDEESKDVLFKYYMYDVGLLTAMYGKETQLSLINNERRLRSGAIVENAVAENLISYGITPYYYNTKEEGEFDFVIESNDEVIPFIVKSGKKYARKVCKLSRLDDHDYNFTNEFVFSDRNIYTEDTVINYPIYMIMFIDELSNKEKAVPKKKSRELDVYLL